MRYADFDHLIRRLTGEVPPEFLEGVAAVEVSPKTLPHPTRAEIYTLGECIPVPGEGPGVDAIQSRVVLYHGSFVALARLHQGFDWREEAWETLTHELRHHLEWRARVPDLEAFDRAAEENFARGDGEPFDPLYPLDGESVAEGVYRIDDDYFIDRMVDRLPATARLTWHGAEYEVDLPEGAELPLFLEVTGIEEPPPGELLLVLRERPRLRHLLRRRPARQAQAEARRVAGA